MLFLFTFLCQHKSLQEDCEQQYIYFIAALKTVKHMMLIRNNFLNIQGYDFFIHLISICTEDLVQRAHGAGQAARWWQSQTPLLLGTVSEDRYESSPQLTYTPLKLFIAVCLCVFVCVFVSAPVH